MLYESRWVSVSKAEVVASSLGTMMSDKPIGADAVSVVLALDIATFGHERSHRPQLLFCRCKASVSSAATTGITAWTTMSEKPTEGSLSAAAALRPSYFKMLHESRKVSVSKAEVAASSLGTMMSDKPIGAGAVSVALALDIATFGHERSHRPQFLFCRSKASVSSAATTGITLWATMPEKPTEGSLSGAFALRLSCLKMLHESRRASSSRAEVAATSAGIMRSENPLPPVLSRLPVWSCANSWKSVGCSLS